MQRLDIFKIVNFSWLFMNIDGMICICNRMGPRAIKD